MLINTHPESKMSWRESLALGIIFVLMIAVTSMNLIFSDTFGETCGFLHPYIFEAQVSIIDPGGGLNWNSDLTNIPHDESDVRVLDTYLRVYGEDGSLLASDDDTVDGDRSSGSKIERFGVSQASTVIVEMGSYGDTGSGRYEIAVNSSQNNNNAVLQNGSTVSGTIYAGESNRLRYPITVAAGETLIVQASGLDDSQAELDTYLRLYDLSNTLVLENDDFSGRRSSALMVAGSADTATNFTLEVGTFGDTGSGQYNLSVSPFVLDVSAGLSLQLDTEPLSNNIALFQRVRHRLSLPAGLRPVFSLTGQDSIGNDLGLVLNVYNEADELLGTTAGYGSITLSDIGVEEAGVIIVEVGTMDDAQAGNYQLSALSTGGENPSSTPLDVQITTGAALSLDSKISAEIAIGERLRYPFTLPAGQAIAIYANGLMADETSLDTVLNVYDEAGNLIISNDDFSGLGSGIVNFSLETETNLSIEVATFGDTKAGTVELRLESYQIEILEQAPVNIGDTINGSIAVGQRLRYPLYLEAGQNLTVFAQGTNLDSYQLDTILRLYDNAGNELASNDDFLTDAFQPGLSSALENFSLPDGGTILLELGTLSDTYAGDFSLYILNSLDEFSTEQLISFGPEISIIENEPVLIGRGVAGTLNINERHHYPLDLAARESVILRFTGESSFNNQVATLPSVLRILDSDEQVLNEAYPYDNNASVLVFSNTKDTPSRIILEIASSSDSFEGTYQLQVLENTVANFEQVYGIQITTGQELDLADAPYVSAEITEGQRQRHEIELTANQIIVVNFGGFSRLDTVARLYSENNDLLKEAYSYGRTTGSFRFRATTEGTYAIEIGTYSDLEAGEYEILVLEVADAGELTLDAPALSGDLKPNQRSQYSLNLEVGQSIDITARQIVPESAGLSLFAWSNYALSHDANAAQQWVSCLEYYGYVVDSAFRVNEYGISRFVLGTKIEDLCDPLREACQLEATVKLTELGQILLYVLLPGLAIILPVITVLILQNDKVWYWVVGLIIVASFVLTSSLLYVHLGTVSGISALQDFGSGIFGGTATGAAIAFMSKVLENFSDRKARQAEQQVEPRQEPPAPPPAA